MEVKRLRILATEIFKTLSNINPVYMKIYLKQKKSSEVKSDDILMRHFQTTKYGTKSLKSLGHKHGTNF